MTAFPAQLRPSLLAILCGTVPLIAAAQTTPAIPPGTSAPSVHYHVGDDPDGAQGWASPTFDDSSWIIATQDLVPSRSGDNSGFVWVRMRVPVPNLQAPLALHLTGLGVQPIAWQVFVNGHALGGQGAFPPHANPAAPPVSPVMDLPASIAPPGSTAVLALREWYAPAFFEARVTSRPVAAIDEARPLRLAVRVDAAETLIANGPQYFLSVVLALVGLALVLIWRSSRSLEYLWAAIMLVTPLFTAILSAGPVTASLSFRAQTVATAALYSAGLLAEIEFMWTLFGLRTRWLRILWHAIWIVFMAAQLAQAFFLDSPALAHFCQIVIIAGVPAFDCILFPVCIREMIRPGGNRAIAAAQSLFEIIVALGIFGYSQHFPVGHFSLDLFQISIMLVGLAIAAMLIRRALAAWRQGNQLRAEFDAAREVQQRLVVPPPTVPGFRMASAYFPAILVGGDFYHIRPDENDGLLLVVGDVSGKGLRAAMAVSAIIGALRAMESRQPSQVLAALNRGLAGNLGGGFVTCCAAHIAADGRMIIANAGHIPPWRNGQELECGNNLPLGIAAHIDYSEHPIQLAPGDSLTFLSDGVVEAGSGTGELFGFDRTRQISTQSAEQIAAAARAWGQEDDITVLTLAFTGAEVAAAGR